MCLPGASILPKVDAFIISRSSRVFDAAHLQLHLVPLKDRLAEAAGSRLELRSARRNIVGAISLDDCGLKTDIRSGTWNPGLEV